MPVDPSRYIQHLEIRIVARKWQRDLRGSL